MREKKILNAFDMAPPRAKPGDIKPTIVKGKKGKLLGINGRLISSLEPNKSNPIGSLKADLETSMTRSMKAERYERINRLIDNKLGYYKSRGLSSY